MAGPLAGRNRDVVNGARLAPALERFPRARSPKAEPGVKYAQPRNRRWFERSFRGDHAIPAARAQWRETQDRRRPVNRFEAQRCPAAVQTREVLVPSDSNRSGG